MYDCFRRCASVSENTVFIHRDISFEECGCFFCSLDKQSLFTIKSESMYLKVSLLAFTTLLLSCACSAQHTLDKASWLLGQWRSQPAGKTLYETWTRSSDTAFAGKGYFLKGSDTVVLEHIRLVARNGEFFYIPVVNNQNNGEPVLFKLTSMKADQLVFENPAHDFPQKITYTHVTADSLLAVTSGMVNGKKKAQEFPMKKVK